ncbi:MAG: 4Fe-4S dicluster domain-containing protein [Oscillospiraceae bacterium]
MIEVNLNEAALRAKECQELASRAGVTLSDCYQCGKCSAGCPMGGSMDKQPHQMLRLLQLGLYEETINASSPWICASCHVCACRCPHGINISELMEAVRQRAASSDICPVKDVRRFTKDFLIPVRWLGRSHEAIMSAFYNITSGHVFLNFSHIPQMLLSGKLGIVPEMSGDIDDVRALIERCEKEAEN